MNVNTVAVRATELAGEAIAPVRDAIDPMEARVGLIDLVAERGRIARDMRTVFEAVFEAWDSGEFKSRFSKMSEAFLALQQREAPLVEALQPSDPFMVAALNDQYGKGLINRVQNTHMPRTEMGRVLEQESARLEIVSGMLGDPKLGVQLVAGANAVSAVRARGQALLAAGDGSGAARELLVGAKAQIERAREAGVVSARRAFTVMPGSAYERAGSVRTSTGPDLYAAVAERAAATTSAQALLDDAAGAVDPTSVTAHEIEGLREEVGNLYYDYAIRLDAIKKFTPASGSTVEELRREWGSTLEHSISKQFFASPDVVAAPYLLADSYGGVRAATRQRLSNEGLDAWAQRQFAVAHDYTSRIDAILEQLPDTGGGARDAVTDAINTSEARMEAYRKMVAAANQLEV